MPQLQAPAIEIGELGLILPAFLFYPLRCVRLLMLLWSPLDDIRLTFQFYYVARSEPFDWGTV